MTRFRKNPLFASALTLCALLVLGEGWCIYERHAAAGAAAKKLTQRRAELSAMGEVAPPPTRDVATAIETDLARARRSLAAMQVELTGHGPAAERMRAPTVRAATLAAARTDAYFELATFVEKTRELANKSDVDVRPEAARFGFASHANEVAEEEGRIEAVIHQRRIAQYLVEALLEAHPRALLEVKREHPLTKKEREERDAAALAAANGTPAPEGAAAPPAFEDGPDFFTLDPRSSVRAPGVVDTSAFRLVFIGETGALRAMLNRLAGFELPVLVREVEVEPVSAEEAAVVTTTEEAAVAEPAAPAAASMVLTVGAPPPAGNKPAPRASTAAPIVAKPFSKFTVTVEYIELVTAKSSETPAGDAAPPPSRVGGIRGEGAAAPTNPAPS